MTSIKVTASSPPDNSENDLSNGNIPVLTDIVKRGDKAPDPRDEDITQPNPSRLKHPEIDPIDAEQATQDKADENAVAAERSDIDPEHSGLPPVSQDQEISDLTRQIEQYTSADFQSLIDKAMNNAMQHALLELQPMLEQSVQDAMKKALQDILSELKNNPQ
jgi:hypothetical protein